MTELNRKSVREELPKAVVIACMSPDHYIGFNNMLLGKVPGDLAHFKAVTSNQVVVMGWNTFRSMGRHLPNRVNVVYVNPARLDAKEHTFVARSEAEGVVFRNTLHDACTTARRLALEKEKECYVIGGEAMYRYALETDIVKEVVLTVAHESLAGLEGDATFPATRLTATDWDKKVRPLRYLEPGVPSRDVVETYTKRA